MSTIKLNKFPDNVFATCERNENGELVWQYWSEDPLRTKHPEKVKLKDFGSLLMRVAGNTTGDVWNPIVFSFGAARLDRCLPFEPNLVADIRKGAKDAHVEDYNGNNVEILALTNRDTSFPLNGVTFDSNGKIIATRQYSLTGICNDGKREHTLMVFVGPAITGKRAPGSVPSFQPIDVNASSEID